MDEKQLEKLYNQALQLEKDGQHTQAAEIYRQALLIDPEDHGGIQVRLASMGQGDVPLTAPKAYVATLFNQTADMFDYILVDQLGYDVPLQLRERLLSVLPDRNYCHFLDLGCGTGLTADALDDITEHKTGVDLSENMIEIAYEKGDYDHLFVADATEYIKQSQQCWNLITATDVLPYMGDLEDFITGVAQSLLPDGIFAFSSEKLPEDEFGQFDYKVGVHQRFAHREAYVKANLKENDMECLDIQNIVVRLEQGEPVKGQLYITRKTR